MKRLRDLKAFKGEIEAITAMEFRKAPGEAFAQVQMGKTFIVTHRGKPIAVLSPPEPTAVELGAAAREIEEAGRCLTRRSGGCSTRCLGARR